MRVDLNDRYSPFGGLDKVFEDYKNGLFTLEDISQKVHISKTSVSNDLKSVFGTDALENARATRRRAASLEKRLNDINAGKGAELEYDEALAHFKNGDLKRQGFLPAFETMIQLAQPHTGKPSLVWFHGHGLCKVQGSKGCVKVRCAVSKKATQEHKIHRYRFKITPAQMKDFDAVIFCILDNDTASYYLFPAEDLNEIQSLNLKFRDYENTKYAGNLAKVEKIS